MESINKNSLIIFGYSEILTLALVVNSKIDKVKEFNIIEDDNEDKFFKIVSNFISNKVSFNSIFYSCGPGGFTIIRRIISYVKALKFNKYSRTKFIGLNNLFIIACYLNLKSKINDNIYILSILNYSKDHFVQIYQKKKNFLFFLKCLSDIKNIELDHIGTYLGTLNLSIQNIHSVYLGANPNEVSFFKNIQIVDRSNILEIIINLSDLIENNKISQTDFKNFFEEKFYPLYGKSPSTN
jgi:tRNA A37 threonylcarbamoyladenosine modification protein TsaB